MRGQPCLLRKERPKVRVTQWCRVTTDHLHLYRIEIDGHFHGGPPPRTWVAEIGGTDTRFGLQRTFVQPLNDWARAHRAWSGNVYGVVSTFPLRNGRVYEVGRCRGKPSKRYFAREFCRVEGRHMESITPEEALAHADGGGPATLLHVDESTETWTARVKGLGTPVRLGFVLTNSQRTYRLREEGVYEVVECGRRRLVGMRDGLVHELAEQEALRWIT
jgi:hypothetical protein